MVETSARQAALGVAVKAIELFEKCVIMRESVARPNTPNHAERSLIVKPASKLR